MLFSHFQEPLRNEKYQEMVTGKDGNFLLHGEEREINGLEPFIEIEHHCIPDKWISEYGNGIKILKGGLGERKSIQGPP